MKIILMLGITLIAALGASLTIKYYTDKNLSKTSSFYSFNIVSSIVAAFVLSLFGNVCLPSAFTVLTGTLFGTLIALQAIAIMFALKYGPMSYTQVIISFSTLISALSGVVLFNETLGWQQIVGMAFMLISFVLAVKNDANKKKATIKWLLLCIIAFLSNGSIGIMQKIHQNSAYKQELNAFLVIAFIVSSSFCAIVMAMLRLLNKDGAKENKIHNSKLMRNIAVMVISGACVALNHKLNLYLSGVIESAVFFPIVNGGGLVLAILSAMVFFKEKLSKKQWVGIICGIVSVVFLCNPF